MALDHLDEDLLESYALGRIGEEKELARVEEHLLACPACARRAAVVHEDVRLMKEALRRLEREGMM
jgi:anti-sigma factor RsiW